MVEAVTCSVLSVWFPGDKVGVEKLFVLNVLLFPSVVILDDVNKLPPVSVVN